MGVNLALAVAVALAVEVGVAPGVLVGETVAAVVGVAVGCHVGLGVGIGVGFGVGFGVGLGVGVCVGDGSIVTLGEGKGEGVSEGGMLGVFVTRCEVAAYELILTNASERSIKKRQNAVAIFFTSARFLWFLLVAFFTCFSIQCLPGFPDEG